MQTLFHTYIKPALLIAAFAALGYYFATILGYLIGAIIVGLLLTPVVRWLRGFQVRGRRMGPTTAALTTLGLLFVASLLFTALVVPLVLTELQQLSQINPERVAQNLKALLAQYRAFLAGLNIPIDFEASIRELINQQLMSSQGIGALGTALGQAFTGFGQFLLGSFSIGFIAFFILRNPKMLPGLFLDLPPQRYRRSFMRAMLRTRELLYRYFFGLLVKVVSLGVIAGTGFLIADVEGAVFFGLVYGALDVIPYLGPLLSTSITTLISLGYALNQPEPMIGWLLLKIGAVFAVAQLSDNFLLEPFIYSGSIRAHPLEVFFVILLAGHIGGIPGMVLGIPIYTVLRVLVQEFAAHLPVVARLMRHQGPQG